MLLRCRSTVFSLSTSCAAISGFVFPDATSRRTSTSRSVQSTRRRRPRAPRGRRPAPRMVPSVLVVGRVAVVGWPVLRLLPHLVLPLAALAWRIAGLDEARSLDLRISRTAVSMVQHEVRRVVGSTVAADGGLSCCTLSIKSHMMMSSNYREADMRTTYRLALTFALAMAGITATVTPANAQVPVDMEGYYNGNMYPRFWSI